MQSVFQRGLLKFGLTRSNFQFAKVSSVVSINADAARGPPNFLIMKSILSLKVVSRNKAGNFERVMA